MRRFRKTFKCSETFPATPGEEIIVRDGRGRTVELWRVLRGNITKNGQSNESFQVEITEYVPVDYS